MSLWLWEAQRAEDQLGLHQMLWGSADFGGMWSRQVHRGLHLEASLDPIPCRHPVEMVSGALLLRFPLGTANCVAGPTVLDVEATLVSLGQSIQNYIFKTE